ncbi:XRE family transcriptional regulator [Streptomyces sp. SID9124]|uniref:XRE family transcriptional regulator n=1 Tax=Streptomyces sp. SID9124 TaxID=2706108 RepID=UPI001EF2DD97|nr:XRE family transcriptional regulator [Streptomyces sp. SID9124]
MAAQALQAFSRKLAEAMERQGVSANALAQKADVNRQVIANVLAGNVWPDVITLANLEFALQERLWPDLLAWPLDEEGRPVEPVSEEKPHRVGSRAPRPRKQD